LEVNKEYVLVESTPHRICKTIRIFLVNLIDILLIDGAGGDVVLLLVDDPEVCGALQASHCEQSRLLLILPRSYSK
jgi:hypothetical protein